MIVDLLHLANMELFAHSVQVRANNQPDEQSEELKTHQQLHRRQTDLRNRHIQQSKPLDLSVRGSSASSTPKLSNKFRQLASRHSSGRTLLAQSLSTQRNPDQLQQHLQQQQQQQQQQQRQQQLQLQLQFQQQQLELRQCQQPQANIHLERVRVNLQAAAAAALNPKLSNISSSTSPSFCYRSNSSGDRKAISSRSCSTSSSISSSSTSSSSAELAISSSSTLSSASQPATQSQPQPQPQPQSLSQTQTQTQTNSNLLSQLTGGANSSKTRGAQIGLQLDLQSVCAGRRTSGKQRSEDAKASSVGVAAVVSNGKQTSGKQKASKSHLCLQCGRSFSRSDMLTRHSRLHSGVKPYQCSKCKQVFSRSDHLSTHERTHTGEKPYQCQQCAYSACRRDMITRHMRTHSISIGGSVGASSIGNNHLPAGRLAPSAQVNPLQVPTSLMGVCADMSTIASDSSSACSESFRLDEEVSTSAGSDVEMDALA